MTLPKLNQPSVCQRVLWPADVSFCQSTTVLEFLPFPGFSFQLLVLIFHTSSTSSHTCSSFLVILPLFCLLLFHLSAPPPGRSGLAASYLSVKALVPQMPKLLKSLFPARDDKKELRPSPHNHQVSRHSLEELIATLNTLYLTVRAGRDSVRLKE